MSNKYNKSSKGQVTIFIILGLLLVISIGLLLYFVLSSTESETDISSSLQTQDVEFMIDNCIKKTGMEGLNILGQNGNYFEIPKLLEMNQTPLWIYKYANVMPVLNSSIDEFQIWFDKEFENCVDYTGFENKINVGKPKSTIQYGAEDVLITLNYPINITLGKDSKRIDRFEHTLNVRYRRIYERAREIVNTHFVQFFDYRNALTFVDQKDFYITYEANDENNLLFTIFDNENPELESIYSFKFATNLEKSKLKRTVDITDESLNFFMPYNLRSPDNLAQLYLQKGVKINQNQLYVWQEYFTEASRTVTSYVSYTIKGGIKPGVKKQEQITWNLTYPIYHFGPDGTEFNTPQRLVLYWDDEKIPNTGPMGMLYNGPSSEYTWMPLKTKAKYNMSFVYTDIPGFSQYTPIDCNRQACKSVSVKSTNQPAKATMCAINQIVKTLLPFLIILIIIIIIVIAFFTMGSGVPVFLAAMKAIFTLGLATIPAGATVAATLGLTAVQAAMLVTIVVNIAIATVALTIIGGLGTVGMQYAGAGAYDSGDTSVSFVPTCDQIIEITCVGDGKLRRGSGSIYSTDLDATIPQASTKQVTVYAGEQVTLSSTAEKCDKGKFKCFSCSHTCTASYK